MCRRTGHRWQQWQTIHDCIGSLVFCQWAETEPKILLLNPMVNWSFVLILMTDSTELHSYVLSQKPLGEDHLHFNKCSSLLHNSWQYKPRHLPIARLHQAPATNPAPAVPAHVQGLESIPAKNTQPVTEASLVSQVGAEEFPLEATIPTTDIRKLLWIVQHPHHIKLSKSKNN